MSEEEKKLFEREWQEIVLDHLMDGTAAKRVETMINSLLSLHDKKLAEKVRGMAEEIDGKDNLAEMNRKEGFNQGTELAAQVIEGKESQ